ncbi:MAG: flagellar biosynthesis protein FlhF [Clostridia bacterium]|jgi:flagellar biosynthesis protein FlhF|nr:flagellar biosynthesis protein FlhF [Clostridia bacterium]
MLVKRFLGKNVHEAMQQVKQEMGANAVILHTRAIKPSGLFGFFKSEQIEITAAIEKNNLQLANEKADRHPDIQEVASQIYQVRQLVNEVKQELEINQPINGYPKSLQKLYRHLLGNQVEPKLAKRLIKNISDRCTLAEVKDLAACEEYLIRLIADLLKKVTPIEFSNQLKIIGLVGPTGVGKTTTIAKLAAHFSILEKKKVALITVDTYRIAAVEQLKTYGEIIGLPVEVVFTPREMKKSLLKFEDQDLILIDTAGRSHKNELHMLELKGFLCAQGLEPVENILVLSATGKNEDLLDIVRKYSSEVEINKIIFTKLDETSTLGAVLNICHQTKKSLSYLTTGQNVPDDIELANPRSLANLIVRGRII